MIIEIKEQWEEQISAAYKRSQKSLKLSKFKNFNKEDASRASYFTEMADVIHDLGLSNPHEKSALSIEPTHPVTSDFMEKAFDRLKISPNIRKEFKDSKMSLISLSMLERYSPNSDAKKFKNGPFKSPLYLLDPLYGFVFFPGKNQIHNHCFAIDIWLSHLQTMPKKLAKDLWGIRADSMLSGGASSGRLLFDNVIEPELDPIKRSSVAEICVNSESELLELLDKLNVGAKKLPNIDLWFRGQNKEYLTPDRTELIKLGITPYSNVRDSDFTPSLYREYDKHLESIESFNSLVIDLAEWVHSANQLASSIKVEQSINGVASVNESGATSYKNGLLLQQYGAPSAYLDITSDISTAAWFATHSCTMTLDNKMKYENYSWEHLERKEWPTIFVFPLVKGLHPYLDLESIMSESNALRPKRQKCGLLGGAGNLARNYCARYLGLKIRLGPNFKLSNPVCASYLFPGESEDMAFKFLKEQGLRDSKRKFILSEIA